jgi:methyl-accepting chemotaxis protein
MDETTLFQPVKIPTFFGTLSLLDIMDISASTPPSVQEFVQSARLWKDYSNTIPSIEAVQAFLLSIHGSSHSYASVMPLFLAELKTHVTTRATIAEKATVESLRNLLDFIVKDSSAIATSLTVDINDIMNNVEIGFNKTSKEIQSITNASSLEAGAVAVTNVVETVAETTGAIAKDVGKIASSVNETLDDAKIAVNSAGLGQTASSVVDAVQTGVKIVSDVAEKTDVVVKKVDEIAEKAETIVRSNARLFQQLQRYLCCCCRKA